MLNDSKKKFLLLIVLLTIVTPMQSNTHAYFKAFLGIESTYITKKKAAALGFANPYGSYVKRVIPGTAAAMGGIKPFDYIFGIDEYRVNELQRLSHILSNYYIGDRAIIHLIRQGESRQIQVTFIKPQPVELNSMDECREPFFGIQQNHSAPVLKGIRVSIVRNSTAEAMGLEDDDILTHINDNIILDWEDASIAIHTLEIGDVIEVDFIRNGKIFSRQGPIKSYCDTKLFRNKVTVIVDEDRSRSSGIVSDVSISQPSLGQIQSINRNCGLALSLTSNLTVTDLRINEPDTEGIFPLSFRLNRCAPVIVRIFNQSGRLVYDYEMTTFSGKFWDEIDIATNGSGDYFLEIKQGTKTAVRKLKLS